MHAHLNRTSVLTRIKTRGPTNCIEVQIRDLTGLFSPIFKALFSIIPLIVVLLKLQSVPIAVYKAL